MPDKVERERRAFKSELRQAVADYMSSGGCSCCQNTEAHDEAKKRLAKMLGVPKYSDGSGFDFYRFKSKRPEEGKGK
jgi:hypothetical protein